MKQAKIKYIENNLVFNDKGECFAYYELQPYHYSFLSFDEKMEKHNLFRQLVSQSRGDRLHALVIATERKIETAQEKSRKGIKGPLSDVANDRIDGQTAYFKENYGETEIDYRYFLGLRCRRKN